MILILRVLRSDLPLPGYSDARNADGQSESNSWRARRVTHRVHPGSRRARVRFFQYHLHLLLGAQGALPDG